MKITIVQAEIEQAICDYINKKLALKGDAPIVIDLFSPRGSTEVHASIDLDGPGEVKEPAPAPVKEKAAVAKPATQEATAPATEAAAPAAETAGAEAGETQAAQTEAEPAAEPPVGEKKPSLFGNLAKPKND